MSEVAASERRPGRTLLVATGSALVADGLILCSALLLHVLLARSMGVSEYGVYAYVMAWLAMLVIVARLGFDTALLRFVAQYRIRHETGRLRGVIRFGQAVGGLGGLCVAMIAGMVVWLMRGSMGADLSTTFFVGLTLVPILAVLMIQQSALRSFKHILRSQLPFGVVQPLLLAGIIAGLWSAGVQLPATRVAAFYGVSVLGALGFATFWLQREMPGESTTSPDVIDAREWIGVSLPMFVVDAMRTLGNRADLILVGALIGTTQAGIYAVAMRLAQMVSLGLQAGNLIMAPLITELHTERRTVELQRVSNHAALIASAVSFLVAVGLVAGRSLILSVFGSAFAQGAPILAILSVGHFFNAATGPSSYLLSMTGFQGTNARINSFFASLNVILDIPAIRWHGMEGAALMTASSMVLNNLTSWYFVRRRLGVNSSILRALNP